MNKIKAILIFGAIMLLSTASFGQNKKVRGNYAGPAYAGLAVFIDTLGYTVVDSSAAPIVQIDSVFEGALLQYDTTSGVWESVNRSAVLGYKEYVALLTQTGTDAPVATVLYNDIGNIVWTRTSAGVYAGTLTGAFPVTNTIFNGDPYIILALFDSESVRVSLERTSDNVVNLYTAAGDGYLDLLPLVITIRVYN